jgi:hypothetical protein
MRNLTRWKRYCRLCGRTRYRPDCSSASRIALAGGLAAACLATVLFRWEGDRDVEPGPVVVLPQSTSPVMVVNSGFTLLAYRRALAQSPEDLDTLLDKDAMAAQKPGPELVRICASNRSDAELHTLLGEN